jgi:hypothetical protein
MADAQREIAPFSGAPSSHIKPAIKPSTVTSPSSLPPKPPRVLLSEETFQLITRGDTFYHGNNFLGIRSSRHYSVEADLKHLVWRHGSSGDHKSSKSTSRVPFTNFDRVTFDGSQSKRGLYVIVLVGNSKGKGRSMWSGGGEDDKTVVLEYQTPNAVRANKWYLALSFCVDKACGRL